MIVKQEDAVAELFDWREWHYPVFTEWTKNWPFSARLGSGHVQGSFRGVCVCVSV